MKWLTYLLLLTCGHKAARHYAYHAKYEEWLVKSFKPSPTGDFWESEHYVTCKHPTCSYIQIARRAQVVLGSWPSLPEFGTTEHEARKIAEKWDRNT